MSLRFIIRYAGEVRGETPVREGRGSWRFKREEVRARGGEGID